MFYSLCNIRFIILIYYYEYCTDYKNCYDANIYLIILIINKNKNLMTLFISLSFFIKNNI